MGTTAVTLDPDDWLPFTHVCLHIASAIKPDRRRATGVDLLTTKLIAVAPEDEPWLPLALTSEDRKHLARILPSLPRLHGKMTDSEREAFLRKYKQLPVSERPSWIPSVPSDQQLYAEFVEMLGLANKHQTSIGQAVRERRIRAIGPDHMQVTELAPHTRLSRGDVVKYLNDCGLSVETRQSDPAQVEGHVDDPSESGSNVVMPSRADGAATWFEMPKWPAESQSTVPTISSILGNEALWPIHKNGAPWSPHEITLLKELRSQVGRRRDVTWGRIERIFDCSRQNLLEILKTKS